MNVNNNKKNCLYIKIIFLKINMTSKHEKKEGLKQENGVNGKKRDKRKETE